MSSTYQSDWKKELYKANRSTVLTVSNETDYILQRLSVKLHQGLLRVFPPETIAPNSKVDFASESNAMLTGTKGTVIYMALPPGMPPLPNSALQTPQQMIGLRLWEPFLYVTIDWSNPYFTTHSCSISTQTPLESKYYQSHEEINRQIHSEVKVHIKGRVPQFKILKSPHSPSPNNSSSSLSSSLSPSSLMSSPPSPGNSSGSIPNTRPNSLPHVASPLAFFSSLSPSTTTSNPSFPLPWSTLPGGTPADKENWKHTVRRATRGQFVSITNKTPRLLIRRDYVLDHGSWAEIPPEGIPPGATIEFGTASGLCAGTDGSIFYYSNGLKGDFKMSFNNPFIGENTFSYHCPPNFVIEKQVVPGTISYVYFTIIDKSLVPSGQSSTTSTSPSMHKDLKTAGSDLPDDSIRIMSLNIGLLSNHSMPPEVRCEHVAKLLVNLPEKYDIICLQEVFNAQSKELLNKLLKPFYSYIVDKSGEDSGLYFASTFPILWSDFRLFNEGIGLDVHASKGVQGVKLDISSVKENSSLYVFNAHLQSNPDGSLAWQMVSGDDKLKKAQTVRTLQLQSIRDFISSEISRNSGQKNAGLILCGDMNIVGEAEQVISDEGSAVLSQIIPELAKKINKNEMPATFSHQLLDNLLNNNVPIRYFGLLRSQINGPRMKSLMLTEMISYIIKKEIIELLSQRHNQTSSINDDESTYRDIILETFNCVFHYDTKASTDYWTMTLKRRLRAEFSSGLTELEELDFVDLRNHVINLQLLTSLKRSLEVTLDTKANYQLIKGSRFKSNMPAPLIVSEHIEELILPPLTSYWSIDNNSDISYISSLDKMNLSGSGNTNYSNDANEENRIKIFLRPTEEYESMKVILGSPNDLYRLSNPHQPGYTIHQSLNQMVNKVSAKERIDYIFSFNLSPNFGDDEGRNQLLRMTCLESSILPMGATPQTRLSDHFAVECVLRVDDSTTSTSPTSPVNRKQQQTQHNRSTSKG
ncbi:hypothetical protein SAMD00019534_122290 [Acytostelium subglobosum LB1]|uniref:hypothetical protein n=1 Tax=Acytostelium subglobosum LB1 TaxID=1410327 RepID=UPI0006449D99|nr:hypothetical protein SAMD00019534_122290 [Acytostelium subglobosum LB1]GAM29053.1 hypothetical protein SAMD00019534_122290 [Acytostelium subglobosum LB1]|eukprot:XP_012748059.1 hypothetical protein SAMD00019534_122290 [Acytostelium subglobosum LB1]